MSHCYFAEDSMQNLRHINRQMRLLDLRLQLLRERLCSARVNRCLFSCCCLNQPCFRRRCIAARYERYESCCLLSTDTGSL